MDARRGSWTNAKRSRRPNKLPQVGVFYALTPAPSTLINRESPALASLQAEPSRLPNLAHIKTQRLSVVADGDSPVKSLRVFVDRFDLTYYDSV